MTELSQLEWRCIECLVRTVADHASDRLAEVWLYGSAARGDMWAAFWPMRSDIDLLIVTSAQVSSEVEDAVRLATYELFLEGGRRIDAPIRTLAQLREQWAPLWREARDGIQLWPHRFANHFANPS